MGFKDFFTGHCFNLPNIINQIILQIEGHNWILPKQPKVEKFMMSCGKLAENGSK